ncbi:MAG: 2-oxo acid dehydrogenase subunit E2, partial [Clostridia bacterium]|nr:2-oxo acid dehydrogenase subunit E2 [Clostridia bacterium]
PAAGQTTDIATVTKLMVSVGDSVKKGDVLLEVETDKAVLPIESFAKGFVTEIYVNEFDQVDAGTLLLAIGDAADLEAAKNKPAEAPAPAVEDDDDEDDFVPVMPKSEPAPAPVSAPAPVKVSVSGKAMPNAKKLASELGVDLDKITPSNGEFIKACDVRAAAENQKKPEIAPAEDVIPTARMRNTLSRRWDAFVPTFGISVTCSDEAYSKLAEKSPAVSPVHYVMMALSRLAQRYPILRALNDGGKLPLSEGSDIGLAVFAENGTVTSVVESAEKLGANAIAEACEKNLTLVAKGDLSSVRPCPVSVYDATGYKVDSFTAPVCAPGVASFGITLGEGSIAVSGSFDIRVIEGNVGASIMSDLREFIENPVLMLI